MKLILLIRYIVLLTALGIIVECELVWVKQIGLPKSITIYENETDAFRTMNLGNAGEEYVKELAGETGDDYEEVLTVAMIYCNYDLTSNKLEKMNEAKYKELLAYYKEEFADEFSSLLNSIKAIFSDIKYFPVPVSTKNKSIWINYVNSWGYERTYGGNRVHEGTDLMADNNQAGYFPIISMTDGVVENIGWLEQGGYRVGIRSRNQGYFYYAHLYSYDENIVEGDTVVAGQILGYMGDTGYSKVEGTSGNFDVHLHMGIYIKTVNYQELSVNPYWVLKSTEDKKLSFSY